MGGYRQFGGVGIHRLKEGYIGKLILDHVEFVPHLVVSDFGANIQFEYMWVRW
jgi:hypothetical protein